MKNPQTTFAPTFLTHIIARIDGVKKECSKTDSELDQTLLMLVLALQNKYFLEIARNTQINKKTQCMFI